MSQIALDSTWDIAFDDNGDMLEVEGPAETTQHSKFRLQIIAGELFEDSRPGVPWLTDMVDPRVSIDTKKQILRDTILGSYGALSVDSLDITTDTVTNIATAVFYGTAQGGTFGGSASLFNQAADEAKSAQADFIFDIADRVRIAGFLGFYGA